MRYKCIREISLFNRCLSALANRQLFYVRNLDKEGGEGTSSMVIMFCSILS